jgi:uncharacterized membrane-anchored protein YitT (DUF2179 family)
MAHHLGLSTKNKWQIILGYFWILVGCLLAALSIRAFLYPNHIIDGGIIGLSLILGRLLGDSYISIFFFLLNAPFIYLAYRFIRRTFVIQMLVALLLFAIFLALLEHIPTFMGDPLEIIVIGGAILGIGVGLIIRYGGCLDGSEILGIIANKRYGFTVGQVVLFFNFFVFALYGLIFLDWHIAVQSLLTFIVAFKMIDLVIVGLEEIKSVSVITQKTEELCHAIIDEMGLGLTITQGRGGYSGVERDLLHILVERLDLADLKDLVLHVDPEAFISVTNIYEVVYGQKPKKNIRSKKRTTRLFK